MQQSINGISFDPIQTSRVFVKISKQVIPTVVTIYSTKRITSSRIWDDNIVDRELRDFLGEKYLNLVPPREYKQKGSGSGIIVTRDGYILTNLHVVESAEKIEVTLSDNRSLDAKIVGADPLTELAVIKIDATDLPAAKLGNSDSVKIGEWVLAVGNPLELKSTVTAGIVSAIGREIDIIDDNFGVENFIQTDATINPGSSGGALVNLSGEVIGINTAIATQSGYNQGYGFAIPINLAKQILSDLINRGYVIRSYLGIAMQDVDEKIARALNLLKPQGVFVDYVSENSPAWKSGLREKDILIAVDHKPVTKSNVIQSLIAQKKPGDSVVLTILRLGKELNVKVILGSREGPKVRQTFAKKTPGFSLLGLTVKSIDAKIAKELDLNVGEGVVVTQVEPESPAQEAQVQVNDVILEVDNQKITSLYLFKKILAQPPHRKVFMMKIKRKDNFFHRFVEAN
ncbi:MAG: Do family serine endopeptidase [Calditrichaeota bacterium]|nr:Do family serine endopeptidase [Calditrichota bacterium]